jgi:hypothetical protein
MTSRAEEADMRITIVVTDPLEEGESWSELMSTLSEEDYEKAVLEVGGYALGGRIESWSVS